MNVKHLLMAMAVPTAFAACSQDEFVNENQKLDANRPVVGAISLNLEDAAQTRWTWGAGTGFTFDNNDYIGACLMDKVANLEAADWASKYTIVNTISTNYKYGYKDGWTNNDAIMSEGNYFFYLPYNNKLKSRAGLSYSIPTEQFAYDEEATTAAKDESRSWKKNQMFIGYDDIKEGDAQAVPNMVELHAKPRFTVKYTGTGSTVVERIVMRDNTGKFAVKGTLKPTGAVSGDYNPIEGVGAPETYKVASANLAVAFAAYNKALAEYELKEGESFVNPLVGNETTFTEVKDAEKEAALSLNFVPAKEVSALMVVPAGTHTLTNLEFDIYTNKGLVSLTNLADKLEEPANGTELTYSNIGKLATIKAGQGVKADAVTINFGDKDVKQPESVTVSTTAQLESIIRWYTDITKDLTVTVVGDKVELSEIVYNTIKGNENLDVKFVGNGTLTIPVDAESDALTLINMESTAKIKIAGTQNLNNTIAATIGYDIEVAAGATLNISAGAGVKLTTVQNIVNKGTLNISAGKVKTNTAKAITNTKNLVIAAGAELEAKVLNKADKTVSGSVTTYNPVAKITNNGMLILLENSENECTIENNNKLNVTGATTNKKVQAVQNSTNGYTGVIKNADATNSYIYANAALTNEGDIDNVGAMYSQDRGSIVNNGYIKAYDGSTTYITTNSNEIELEKRDTEAKVNEDNGRLSYTMKADDLKDGAFKFDKTSDKFNSLKVGMDVTFAGKDDAPAHIVLQGQNLKVVCKTVKTKFESITAEKGHRYVMQGAEVITDKLVVEEEAVFQVPALSKFFVTTADITNSGEVLVGGEFSAVCGDTAPNGTFSSAGDGSYNWNWTAPAGN